MVSPDKYLDDRNRNLWDDLNKSYPIQLKYSNDQTYAFSKIADNVTIFVSKENICAASFTHELLHLWLTYRNVFVSEIVNHEFSTDRQFRSLIDADLRNHVTNCIDHGKMLNEFVYLGFEQQKFIYEYDKSKYSEFEMRMCINWINSHDQQSRWYAVKCYIKLYFAMKACPNKLFDYTNPLKLLSQHDFALFRVLDGFWQAWQRYKIETSSYQLSNKLAISLTDDLKTYLKMKF